MVSQSKCQCTMSRFIVGDILVSSKRNSSPFFFVMAQCVDCEKLETVSEHTMPVDGCLELFKEHHEMTKEFYKEME